MTIQPTMLKIRRPDDLHVHVRDDDMLRTVLPYTSRYFGRAIIMPNLTPPITTLSRAISYRERILAALPPGHCFQPLMTCYLTDSLDRQTLIHGHHQGIFTAAKLYQANATTNSERGVTNITDIYPLLETMETLGMPLLIHGEVTASDIDIFDREAYFIEQVMEPMRCQFPTLKIILEHITTKEAVDYVLAGDAYLGATITPQHLMFNRNHMLVGGARPHLYCLPILKSHVHQQALRAAVAGGCSRLFLGTDSAPHIRTHKESDCCCAGIFNSPTALPAYATVFEEIGALVHLEKFCSLNGAHFYGLPLNEGFITLRRETHLQPATIPLSLRDSGTLVPFLAGQILHWTMEE
ncbi:dihydroorotase [secondary endosymbiont of Ctenarytaina eucalypti]|uniref:Dihydroorotase n=1 Tax=secondary endosymbiont of Ctenarytaina eucalypti TaxID=1199245 RepID=J3TFT0_9ENTR|nr:dihydroorotase [secondary endosymbiont of Ctenarytaina eucalypti]AFP85157.1 dihydroorotase [secondary endosymbiont of Ctenarytaina eucalypti]